METPITTICKDLGWCIARGDKVKMQLTICSPSSSDEGFHQPCSDVSLYRREDIESLRDFCIELLTKENKSS